MSLDIDLASLHVEFVELLGQHLDAHVLEQRNHFRQLDRAAQAEHLKLQDVRLAPRAMQTEADVLAVAQAGRHLHVRRGDMRGDFLDVAGRQRAAVARGELEALVFAMTLHQRIAQVVVPVAHDVHDLRLEIGDVVAGLVARLRPHDQMQHRQRRLADLDGRIDALAVEGALQGGFDAFAHGRIESIARQIDQAGIEAPVLVAPREQTRARPFAQRQDAAGDIEQFVLAALEQFVARQQFEHMTQRLAGVRIAAQAGTLHHRLHLASHQRHILRTRHVGGGGEQAEEALLDHRHAGFVEGEYADVVHVAGPMHAGARIGLGQDDRVHRAGLRQFLRHQGAQRARRERALAAVQDAEAGAIDRLQHFVVAGFLDPILAIAQEGEIVVGSPAQELLRFGDAGSVDRQLALRQLVCDRQHAFAHRLPIVHAGAHVVERGGHAALEALQLGRLADAVDFEMHHRFGRSGGAVAAAEIQQMAAGIARDAENRMDDRVHGQAAGGDRHADRVDQERRVFGDHIDQGARGDDPVFALGRVADAHLGRAAAAFAHEVEHVLHHAGPFGGAARGQFLGRHPAQEFAGEGLRVAQARAAQLGRLLGEDGIEGRAGNGALGSHEGIREG